VPEAEIGDFEATRRVACLSDALRLIPICFFTQSGHKLLIKWAVSRLRQR
jgi:hypothetical protein